MVNSILTQITLHTLLHVVVLCFLQVFRGSYIGKRGVDFNCTISFGYIPSRSRCGNVLNELVHRAGPPFLDNHYRGYQ